MTIVAFKKSFIFTPILPERPKISFFNASHVAAAWTSDNERDLSLKDNDHNDQHVIFLTKAFFSQSLTSTKDYIDTMERKSNRRWHYSDRCYQNAN